MPVLPFEPGLGRDRDEWIPPPHFGAAVRAARLRSGLTQKELSALLSRAGAPVDAGTIGAWERGPQEPRPSTTITVLEQVLGLTKDALRVRLSGRTHDREAFDLRRLLRPERLNYVTTAIAQHVQVGADGRVTSIETTQRVRALFSGVIMCVFAHEDNGIERVQVRAVSGCETDYWWPRARGVLQIRIGLPGDPLRAGEQRTFRYRVEHTYCGPGGPATPDERRHRANGTPTLERLEIRASFAAPGFTVRRCTWLNRHADPLSRSGRVLLGRHSPVWVWRDPREHTYGISWDRPV